MKPDEMTWEQLAKLREARELRAAAIAYSTARAAGSARMPELEEVLYRAAFELVTRAAREVSDGAR